MYLVITNQRWKPELERAVEQSLLVWLCLKGNDTRYHLIFPPYHPVLRAHHMDDFLLLV